MRNVIKLSGFRRKMGFSMIKQETKPIKLRDLN